MKFEKSESAPPVTRIQPQPSHLYHVKCEGPVDISILAPPLPDLSYENQKSGNASDDFILLV